MTGGEGTGGAFATALAARRVLVVCGSGGVGKTTVSAALGLALARRGRRTVVMTVDPARRLATALGLPARPGERSVVRVDDVSFDVITLDTKRTFDHLVAKYAGSAERRDRIYANGFYQRMAGTLSGTHEYMAMERLYELATDEDEGWESIVVDTPPTRSALAFLDAPKRMTDFLGGRMFKWLLWPYRAAGRTGLRGAGFGARALSSTIGRIAGSDLLAETAEFLGAFEGMYDGFKERAAAVLELMASDQTAFLVVTAPEPASLAEAAHFLDRLAESRMDLAGVLVNRWPPAPAVGATADHLARLERGTNEERAVAAMIETAGRLRALRARGELAIGELATPHPDVPLVTVGELPVDLPDVEAIDAIGRRLFEG